MLMLILMCPLLYSGEDADAEVLSYYSRGGEDVDVDVVSY
jgi:hypothetical protein